ncbi:MAG: hypothetical protein WBZ36_19270 [Candidatus Nitrosopolaris sp.]
MYNGCKNRCNVQYHRYCGGSIAVCCRSYTINPPGGHGAASTVPLTYKHRFDDIKDMSIADGLKVILIEHSFTCERLIRLSPSDLASMLGIDEYVAKIIHNAAEEHLSSKTKH